MIGDRAAKEVKKPLTRALSFLSSNQVNKFKPAHHQLSKKFFDVLKEHRVEMVRPVYDGLNAAVALTILPALLQEEDVLEQDRTKAKGEIDKAVEVAQAADTDGSEAEDIQELEQEGKDVIDDLTFSTSAEIIALVTQVYTRNIENRPDEICGCSINVRISGATNTPNKGIEAEFFEKLFNEKRGRWKIDFVNAATTQILVRMECPPVGADQELTLEEVEAASTAGTVEDDDGDFFGPFTDSDAGPNFEAGLFGGLSTKDPFKGLAVGDVVKFCFRLRRVFEDPFGNCIEKDCEYCFILRIVCD